VDRRGDQYAVSAVLLVPAYLSNAQTDIQNLLRQALKRDATVQVRQTLEASDNARRDRADIDSLRAQIDDLTLQVSELKRQTAPWIAMHVKDLLQQPADVAVDMSRRRIVISLPPMANADDDNMRALKQHLSALEPGWEVEIVKLSPTAAADAAPAAASSSH
jgi:hypothetical protein